MSWYSPFSSIIFFDTTIFLKHRRVSVRKVLILWDKKFQTENRDTPPLSFIKVLDTRNFLKHRRVPLGRFSVLWGNKFSTGKRDTPLPSYPCIFSYQIFSEAQKFFPTNSFVTVRQKNVEGKSWHSRRLIHKNSGYGNVSEAQKGSSKKSFNTVRQKIWHRKTWHQPSCS